MASVGHAPALPLRLVLRLWPPLLRLRMLLLPALLRVPLHPALPMRLVLGLWPPLLRLRMLLSALLRPPLPPCCCPPGCPLSSAACPIC